MKKKSSSRFEDQPARYWVAPKPYEPGFAWAVVVTTFSRLVLNTTRRFPYTFASVLSRGLGVPLTGVTSLIAATQATALLGVFFGPLADRIGYRLMMLVGLGLLIIGALSSAAFPYYLVILVGMLLAGIGKTIFDPALQGYMGSRIPFHRRGLVIGILEFSWSGCTLVGIPLVGFLIAGYGWRSAFWALGILALVCLVILKFLIAKDQPDESDAAPGRGLRRNWGLLLRERAALGAMVFGFMISAANDNLFVVYGAWMEKTFGLGIVALGAGTSVIGAAELGGELLVAAVSDRIGLVRAIITGLLLSTAAYLVLPLIGTTLPLAWFGLFAIFLSFEFMVVAFISLCTELLPRARATMMAGFLATCGLGRVTGALIGGPVWLAGGIKATGAASAVLSLLGLAALLWGLHGWKKTSG